ncbi:YlbL family protein [Paenibacillus thermotolerans]|uniref:YlbL family protein n=1 Tax=Paenibacillus thermotolerans TaxID=3027807 RepID=UPI0023680ABD|nr:MULTISPECIES: PDZ domain-containing protein [unclassified Paenibacillus]
MPGRLHRLNNTRSFILGMVTAALLFVLLSLLPVPYVVYEPGTAERTRDMVEAAHIQGEEQGALLLTTVHVQFANVYSFVKAGLSPNAQLFHQNDILRGNTKEDYDARQQVTMKSSQGNAIEAAYNALDIPYQEKSTAIVVMSVEPGLGAAGVLRPGDELKKVRGHDIRTVEDVVQSLEGSKLGDKIEVAYRRGEQQATAEIELKPLPGTDPPKPGIGIAFGAVLSVVSDDPNKQVNIKVSHIGGPSAGLMFALEIVNQLTEDDVTRGHIIAGTGVISPQGEVGSIGGIRHKVVAADREGAEVFFAPVQNAQEAEQKAKEIGTGMKIVPVKTLRDALDYLEQLPPVSNASAS